MKALASQGLLGLIIPKEYGGMGQNHVCCVMVVETIARYGCPSTAMVYSEYRVHVRKKKEDLYRNMLSYVVLLSNLFLQTNPYKFFTTLANVIMLSISDVSFKEFWKQG